MRDAPMTTAGKCLSRVDKHRLQQRREWEGAGDNEGAFRNLGTKEKSDEISQVGAALCVRGAEAV